MVADTWSYHGTKKSTQQERHTESAENVQMQKRQQASFYFRRLKRMNFCNHEFINYSPLRFTSQGGRSLTNSKKKKADE